MQRTRTNSCCGGCTRGRACGGSSTDVGSGGACCRIRRCGVSESEGQDRGHHNVPQSGFIRITDLIVIGLIAPTYRGMAARAGLPLRGEKGIRKLHTDSCQYDPITNDFVPLSHETFGQMSDVAVSHFTDFTVGEVLRVRREVLLNSKLLGTLLNCLAQLRGAHVGYKIVRGVLPM